MSFMSLLMPVLVATLATASPLSSQIMTKQDLAGVPAGWELKAPAPGHMTMDMHIGLKEENLDTLRQRALQIADPDHADYGKHMSKAEIDALTAPSKATVDAVTEWLASHGVSAGEVNSGFMKVAVTVEKAEQMLSTNYGVYHDAARDRTTVRTTKYSLPKSVHDSISLIQPTTLFTDFGMGKARRQDKLITARASDAKKASACASGKFTPDCLREDYNISGYTPTNKTTIGMTGFLKEDPSTNDLSLFVQKYTKFPKDTSYSVVTINNGTNGNSGTGEANLDTQIVKGLTYPINNVFYSTGGQPPFTPDEGTTENTNEPYLDWVQYMVGLDTVPQTISNSYGDDEQTVPRDYADKVCTQFMKLGARGVSVLVSSGDEGAAGIRDKNGQAGCHLNDGSNAERFLPSFPPSCEWVTVVGGTTGSGTKEAGEHDGGGGFSNYYPQPDYQKAAVASYVKGLGKSLQGMYNTSGRAYPDISAAYNNFPIYLKGDLVYYGGTSAACPAVASVIALLNDYLVSQKRAPLGFLNPWLYKKGNDMIRDIAQGNNVDCHNKAAFPAKAGWDASTGWGVPDFVKMKKNL
ncbi:hypothetical protein VHEMI01981 [[Torrubiella] hemipterigena]|uniref:tripeptidyl-peptidase II n=1 Tax=[Torrubiella] hemipterigena TaxID=1531966 RepID=A0A0A1T921_9HYPO|nr:hypothetical protein VHEMI01981 [[Torrubiella] hemipterigena]